MNTRVELSRNTPHHPDVVWEALRHPRADYFGSMIDVAHTGLDDDKMVQAGSRLELRPAATAVRRVPWPLRRLIQPIGLEVAELDSDDRMRKDTALESGWVEGRINRYVVSDQGGSLVVMEADLATTGVMDVFARRLPKGMTPDALIAREMAGSLDNLVELAGELAAANSGA